MPESLKACFAIQRRTRSFFSQVLTNAKEIIGKSAGQGTMYYASEPLDNPDYEDFLRDYVTIFGQIPQITTATALRHTELLHRLLRDLNEDGRTIYRFSVLSKEDALKIFKEFTPEELVYTELLPQYEDAPQSGFADVGRRAEITGEYGTTISCVTGFVVNFAAGTIRLIAPAPASAEHPTGEIIFETARFADADECIGAMKNMIAKYMSNIISPDDRVRLRDGLTWSMDGDSVVVESGLGTRFTIAATEGGEIYKKMMEVFGEGYHTKREIVAELLEPYKGMLVRSDTFHYAINRMWELGILELESGKV